jgi:hypothetical protein
MKKLIMGLGLVVLLAGCASEDHGNMGGTGDESWKTDSYNADHSGVQYHNNAVNGTGSPLVPYGNGGW